MVSFGNHFDHGAVTHEKKREDFPTTEILLHHESYLTDLALLAEHNESLRHGSSESLATVKEADHITANTINLWAGLRVNHHVNIVDQYLWIYIMKLAQQLLNDSHEQSVESIY